MNQAGLALIALAGLWFAYLVPHRLRYRQQLVEARVDDRFSARLRVLRVAHAARTGAPASLPGPAGRVLLHPWALTSAAVRSRPAGTSGSAGTGSAAGTSRAAGTVRTSTGAGRAGREGGAVNRPHVYQEGVASDVARHTAAARAQRAAHLSRRAAAARRRALLTGVLLVATVGAWTAVALGAALVAGLVPTLLLLGTLVLGRRAVVAGARADAAWAAQGGRPQAPPSSVATRAARTGATVGRAVRPSDATTEVMARVPARSRGAADGTAAGRSSSAPTGTAATSVTTPAMAPQTVSPTTASTTTSSTTSVGGTTVSTTTVTTAAPEQVTEVPTEEPAENGPTWSPVPVPRPAYTLKPAARRAEPAPLDPGTMHPAAGEATRAATGAGAHDEHESQVPAETGEAPAAAASTAAGGATDRSGLDLDAILARRRASGE